MYFFLVIQLKNVAGFGDYANSYIAICPVVFFIINCYYMYFYRYIYSGITIANTKVAYMLIAFVS